MLLKSDDIQFRLTIIGYQFPEMQTEEYDSNWLRIRVDVHHPKESWSATDSSLLTYEVAELASWVDAVARGDFGEMKLGFIEPNMRFSLVPEKGHPKAIRVTFGYETSPPSLQGTEDAHDGFAVDFPLADLNLPLAAQSLRSQLDRFPQRADI